VSETIDRILA